MWLLPDRHEATSSRGRRSVLLQLVTLVVLLHLPSATPSPPSPSSELALGEGKVFTFDGSQSFIELRPAWPLNEEREVAFKFRTLLTHTMLMYHSMLGCNVFSATCNYELYVQLENARLKVIHIFGNDHETLYTGEALNQDRWHTVILTVKPESGHLSVSLDGLVKEITLQSLVKEPRYGIKANTTSGMVSVIYFGGLDLQNILWNRQYSYTRFQGCVSEIKLKTGGLQIPDLKASNSTQVSSGCVNKCKKSNLCRYESKCINLYSTTTCDCFEVGTEGKNCESGGATTLTLRGYAYVAYKIYDWDDKVHSDSNRISITFRTRFDDSVLFYGSGENPIRNYIAASLVGGKVHFAVNFGDEELTADLGSNLANNRYHTFTVVHKKKTLELQLDKDDKVMDIVSPNHYMHFDPKFYVGGIPRQGLKLGLKTRNRFVGNIQKVYFNTISILEKLRKKDSDVSYRGIFDPDYTPDDVETMPTTYPFKDSMISVRQHQNDSMSLKLDFKTSLADCVIANAELMTLDESKGRWEVRLEDGVAHFDVYHPTEGKVVSLEAGAGLNNGQWQTLVARILKGKATLIVNYRSPWAKNVEFTYNVKFMRRIDIGSSEANPESGFVGCMREIYVDGILVDPRPILNSDQFRGLVTMDHCRLVDPCQRPGVCEHRGQCFIVDGETACNCTGTGYTGVTCHFSLFKRTCEELFLVGHREPGIYMIDIDGNGPHPPVPVRCEINPSSGVTTTTVEHNLLRELDIRGLDMPTFRIELKYRDFTPEMLQNLIQHSKSCTQTIRYSCHKAKLGLGYNTWFRSSYNMNKTFHGFGSKRNGYCPCGETDTCINGTKLCNCDLEDGGWYKDEAEIHDPEYLGITEMNFVQPPNVPSDVSAKLYLGPLQCIEMDTQRYVMTFKTSDSYLEVPGWRVGDLAFSFRTSNNKAVLLYQPSHQDNNYFRVLLVNEHELSFEYTVDGQPRKLKILSQTPLNSGEWQQVWVDYDTHHVRFTINMDSEMINLDESEQFGPFDGPLYVGGAPAKYHEQSPVSEGFVGCFRGLVLNDEIVNVYYYLSSRTPQVIQGCTPSCEPNLCLNGATCHEFWGSYECECANPLAHSGPRCEFNLNQNGITFVTEPSYYQQLFESDSQPPPFLTGNILLNIRTYITNGLILYAHDHFNNFIQLHIQNGQELVFTFNSHRELVQAIVKFPELTRGEPIQIHVVRHSDRTIIHANNHETVLNQPLLLVDKYRQNPWIEAEELEIIKPPRPPVEPKNYLQYFLGGINKESMDTDMDGYIGCLNGLKIGNLDIDLETIVRENPGTEGFRMGCKMSCDNEPCKNNGYCVEDWRNQHRSCNCTYTSYRGKSCDEETAGTFDGQSFIKYKFYPAMSIYDKVQVKIAFATDVQKDRPSFLLFVNSKVDERNYIFISLLPDGKLKIEEDDGTGKVIQLITEAESGTFADGVRHWVYFVRNDDHVQIFVDGIEGIPNITDFDQFVSESDPTKFGGDHMDVVIVGGIDFKDTRFSEFTNYTGCLSNVMVEVDTFNIYPLDTAFGYQPGGDRIQYIGTVQTLKCFSTRASLLETTTPSPANLTWYRGPTWNPPIPERLLFTLPPFTEDSEWELAQANMKRVALAMGAFLLVIIIALGVYLWRLDWKDKQYRYEEGLNKTDSPRFQGKKPKSKDGNVTAVSFSRTPNSVYDREHGNETEMAPLTGSNASRPHANNSSIEDTADSDQASPPPMKRTSSQELDWDPSADNTELLGASNKTVTAAVVEPQRVNPIMPLISKEEQALPLHPPTYDEAIKDHVPLGPRHFSPVFLNEGYRTFANPISYLGGPRITYDAIQKRDSILSLD